MVKVSSWGRLSAAEHDVLALQPGHTPAWRPSAPGIFMGMGRSYGDVCLNPGGALWQTTGLNHYLAFDPQTGILHCESGTLLRDIQLTFVPQGWMLPVTPGTQFVTVGGAIANDVHGKNHHVMGSFGDHVVSLELARSNGEVLHCSPQTNADMLEATIGGFGMTGLIKSAAIRLRPVQGPWLSTESMPYRSLSEFFELADSSEKDWEYTVSWIDCIGGQGVRGIFMRGNHAAHQQAAPPPHARSMPMTPPISMVNALSLRAFNLAYFNWHSLQAGAHIEHYQKFFYPLDSINHWNRMYGPQGFYQHQCVLPRDLGPDALNTMVDAIKRSGEGSFLAVLKTFGQRKAPGLMSFAMPGVTLALDFPNRGPRTLQLLARLNDIVAEAKGRIYVAKDACMPRALFEQGYPQLPAFLAYRDPGVSSALSRRLIGT